MPIDRRMHNKHEETAYHIMIVVLFILTLPALISVRSACAFKPQVAAGGNHTVGLKSDGTEGEV